MSLVALDEEMWREDDIVEYDGTKAGGSWRLKACPHTLDVLVCMAGVKSPFRDHPDAFAGQIFIDGEPWVSEFVAFVSLTVAGDVDAATELYLDILQARHQATRWLRDADVKVREGMRVAQEQYEQVTRGTKNARNPHQAS